jgi:hypothetical protein
MGNLTGNAVTLCGDEVQVVFSKEGDFPYDTVLRIVGIHMQMDGGEEYVPSRTTTASVTCLTDGAELLLSMIDEAVSVVIANTTRNKVLFRGWVVPNSFTQGVSGVNDVVTIECVDSVGYAQYVHYSRVGDDDEFADKGFQALTLRQVFERIAGMIGAQKVAIPNSVVIRNPESGAITTAFEKMTLREEYLFASSVPSPDITDAVSRLSYMPYAMTCREALEMIAESLRMTWMQVGDTLYLHDDVGSPMYIDLATGMAAATRVELEIGEEDVRDTACNVSTHSHYSMVTLHHEKVDEIAVVPDAFDEQFLSVGVNEMEVYDGKDDKTKILATRLDSSIYAAPYHNAAINASFVAWKEVKGWTDNGVFVYDRNTAFGDGSWSTAIRLWDISPNAEGLKKMLSIKPHFPLSAVMSGTTYMYFDVDFVASNKGIPEFGYLYPKNEEHKVCYLWAAVKVGGLYYNIKTNDYQEEEKRFLIMFDSEGDYVLKLDNASVGYDRRNIPLLREGEVEVIIYSRNTNDLGWNIGFFTKFNVVLRRSYAQEKPLPAMERYGSYEAGKDLDVTLPIDLHYTMAAKRWGTVIDGVDYRANGEVKLFFRQGYAAQSTMPMVQRIYAQANKGDGLIYELGIDDRNNSITALDSFACAMWDGAKSVVGYAQDVLDNKITLTLI